MQGVDIFYELARQEGVLATNFAGNISSFSNIRGVSPLLLRVLEAGAFLSHLAVAL